MPLKKRGPANEGLHRFGRIEMRTLILSVLFALAVIGAGVAVFAHEIPDFSHKHEDGEAIRKKA